MEPFNKQEIPLQDLKHWFEMEKRIFPWRINPHPYAVWVSEMMLQQTRASVVIPYFERWMDRFPTIQDLSQSTEEEVIKLWEGLGYYSRARSLYKGAKYVMEHHDGKLPGSLKQLLNIPGIGPYTAGAILSFGFRQKAIAIDGNVMRVIARLYCYEDEIDRPAFQKFALKKMEELLPDTDPWIIMEAFIELGATLCNRPPICKRCPMQDICQGYLRGKASDLPKKKKRVEVTYLKRTVSIIYHQNDFLIRKEEKRVMAGLYEFPYFEDEDPNEHFYPGKLISKKSLRQVDHSFTRYKASLFPTLWEAEEKKEIKGYDWISYKEMEKLPFSAGHRKILKQLREHYAHIAH